MPALQSKAGHLGRFIAQAGRQRLLVGFEAQERLAAALDATRDRPRARASRSPPCWPARACALHRLRSSAKAACRVSRSTSVGSAGRRPGSGQQGHRRRVNAAVAAEDQKRIDRAHGNTPYKPSPALNCSVAASISWPFKARTSPSKAHHHRHRLSDDLHLGDSLLLVWMSVRRSSPLLLGVGLDFLDHGATQAGGAVRMSSELPCSTRSSFNSCSI